MNMITPEISRTLIFVMWFLFGGAAGIVVNKISSDEQRPFIEGFAKWVIKFILLPFFIYLTLAIQEPFTGAGFAPITLFGGVIWATHYFVSKKILRTFNSAHYEDQAYLPFMISSFGGGNRGALFISLFIIVAPQFGSTIPLLSTFVLLDIGYFVALMLFGRIEMAKSFHCNSETIFIERARAVLKKGGWGFGMIIFALITSFYSGNFIKENYLEIVIEFKNYTSNALAFFTAFTSFYYASIADQELKQNLIHNRKRIFVISRIAATAVLLLFFIEASLLFEVDSIIKSPALIALVCSMLVFLILPPSSLIDDLIGDLGAPRDQVLAAASLNRDSNVTYSLLFLAIAGISILVSLIDSQNF